MVPVKVGQRRQLLWTRQFGSGDPNLGDSITALSLDDSGGVYAAGPFSGSVDFDPTLGAAILTANSDSQNTFVAKLDSNGTFLSARRMGGQGINSADNPRGIQASADAIYTTGVFLGVGDFDSGTETVLQTSSGTDVFVVKTTQDRGAIFGRMFVDSDGDGTFDANEIRCLIGPCTWTRIRTAYSMRARPRTTGPAGDYVFQHLLANTPDTPYYVAQQLPPGWEETTAPGPLTIGEGEFRTDQDFGTLAAADVSTYTQSSPMKLRDNRTVTATLNVTDTYNSRSEREDRHHPRERRGPLGHVNQPRRHTSSAVLLGWRNRRQLYRHHVRRPGHNADLSRYRPVYGQLHPRFVARRPGERKCQRNMESRNS